MPTLGVSALTSRGFIVVGILSGLTWLGVKWIYHGAFALSFVFEALGVLLFYLLMAGVTYVFVERGRDAEQDQH